MQFLVVAYDGTDAGAKERRLAAREQHLEGAQRLKAEGHFVAGGAILNAAGDMIGSTLLLDFPTRADLDACIAGDPYTKGNVWADVKVEAVRLVLRD